MSTLFIFILLFNKLNYAKISGGIWKKGFLSIQCLASEKLGKLKFEIGKGRG